MVSLLPLPKDMRPRAYAGAALIQDLLFVLHEAAGIDHESIAIFCAVTEATMRPLVFGPAAPLHLIEAPLPPEELRGSISRLAVADVTGLPRETVRRKINQMLASGMLVEDAHGQVKVIRGLVDERWQKVANDIFSAVLAYDRTLRASGARGING